MGRTESVTDDLRRDILDGELPPGDRLQEIPLAERYACGRAAVRAALVELGAEGLVEREPNRGAKVRRISIEEAIEITEARGALESLIAARAARAAEQAERNELSQVIVDMRSAVADGRNADYSALNGILHRRLCEIGGHTIADQLVRNLRDRAANHQYRLALMPGRPALSLEQHTAIVDAVVAGNEEAAATAMRNHLQSVVDALRRWGDATAATGGRVSRVGPPE